MYIYITYLCIFIWSFSYWITVGTKWHQYTILLDPQPRPFGPFAGPKRKASPQSPHALQRRCGATPLLGTWEMSSGFPMACSLENDIATKVSHGLTISHHHIASKIFGNRSSIHWGQIYQRHRQIISDLPTAPASCWRGWKHFHQGRAFHGQRRQWHWRCDGNAHHHRAKGSWRSWRKQKMLQDGHLRTRKRWGKLGEDWICHALSWRFEMIWKIDEDLPHNLLLCFVSEVL